MEYPLQYWQNVQTTLKLNSQYKRYLNFTDNHTHILNNTMKNYKFLHTEFVAITCKVGLESSNNFCTILRNDSTNRFRVCAWHATSNKSIASIAISTSLKKIRCF